ncbi:E3 ubiquitin-protein ligase Topors-like [Narcine bancroftii]|uniref:E3 ubiquitin-protein ligase Topors-like n=1 Tax=Narcine bancroftii TaxID=1343680 RepID=UPI003831F128
MASPTEDLEAESQFSPEQETSKIQHGVRADVSPDAKCPICLDRFDNMSYIDRCFHKFCFRCIQEWSHNKAECPLCKQPFNSIFHSVRTENDFQEYVLKATENGSFGTPGGQRFRYRTTLTRERRMAQQSRNSPIISQLPDNGVVFEGLGRQPRVQQGRSLRRMMTRVNTRRRAQSQGASIRQIQEQEMVNYRRELYRSGIRVRNVQDGGRYRDVSAEFFRRNAACLHRLMPWLKRELCVLFGSHGSIVNIVQHIIMSNIVRYDMEGEAFQEELRPFLLSRTDHFLHEFISFARAPFNMESYDQRANYDCPAPSYEEESDSDLSVIAISPVTASPHRAGSQIPNPSEIALSLSQATWDDETPGPSYSVTETLESGNSSPDEASVVSEEAASQPESSLPAVPIKADPGSKEDSSTRSGDDCLIVGYVKPLAERTPELIELSSDSEVSTPITSTEVVVQPVHTQFRSSSVSSCFLSTRSSSTRSSSTRSSVSRDRWKRKKSKRKKRSKSKREKYQKKNSHTGGSTSSSSRYKTKASSRIRGSSRDRCRFRSQSRDKHNLQRDQRSGSTDRTMVAHSHSRSEHRAKNWSQSSTRDQTSVGDRARSASRESCTYHSRNRRRSRDRERASSTRSRTKSQNSDSMVYRHRPRSRSWSRDYATVRDRRRSRSRERMYSYTREYQERDRGFSYQWERYSYHSRSHSRHDAVARNRILHRRPSPCSDYRIRSSSESTSFRSPSSHREEVYYQYRNYHSRSPSSTRSRTTSGRTDKLRQEKPGGKRKYKTHYLESSSSKDDNGTCLQIAKLASEIHTLPRRESSSPRPHSQCSSYSKSGSVAAESTKSSERRLKRHREKRRSSSVEIVYEGKATVASRHRKQKKKHKQREKSSQRKDCTTHSPLVITIESDSDEVVVATVNNDNSTVNKASEYLKNSSFDLTEQHIMETLTPQELPSTTANTLFRDTSTESLDVCGLPTDFDLTTPKPSKQTCLKQEVTNAADHQNFVGEEQGNRQHCPSPMTTLPKNTSSRPPLILKISKRFFNGTNLFNSSMENA